MTVLAVDIGGTKTLTAAVDRNYRLVTTRVESTAPTVDEIISRVEVMAKDIAGQLGLRAYGLGVAVAGLVDGVTGTVLVSPNLPLAGIHLKKQLEARLLVPCVVDNDASLAALGELACGAAVGLKDVVVLTLGTGIGGGIIANGKLYRGYLGTAAEVGHMVVIVDGPLCPCGRHGCLEALASGTAIGKMGRDYASQHPESAIAGLRKTGEINGERLAELAHQGDTAAVAIFHAAGAALGIGLGNLVNLLAPQCIVLGGGAAASADLIMTEARKTMLATAIDPRAGEVEIRVTTLGNQAGLLGAAALVRELLGDTT